MIIKKSNSIIETWKFTCQSLVALCWRHDAWPAARSAADTWPAAGAGQAAGPAAAAAGTQAASPDQREYCAIIAILGIIHIVQLFN